jgi:RNA recognition motif-containing protein
MNRRLHVSNLAANTSDTDLQQLFAAAGEVSAVQIVRENGTGVSRGFAFVDMATEIEADTAVTTLHETYFQGRALSVTPARQAADAVRGFGRPRGNRRW